MNKGTIIRTVARIAFSAYTAFCIWQAVVDGFGNKTVSFVWAIAIIFCGWIVDFATTYFNNDFTDEARVGTAITRQLKAEKKPDYIGDKFFDDIDDIDEEAEDEQEDI